MRKKIFSFVLMSLVLLSPFQAKATIPDAQNYLASKPNSPWATIALATLGAPSIPTSHLTNINGSSAVEYEAPILAITALGKDPRTFGTQNYVNKLKGYYTGGQIGDTATLNDDFFGLLALSSSGERNTDSVIVGSRAFILANQNQNGGWGFTTSSAPDTNMTSIAVAALIATGSSPTDTAITKAITFIKATQNSDGGFPYDSTSTSDSSSTAWAMWAFTAAGISPSSITKDGKTPNSYLSQNQAAGGYYKYQDSSSEDAFSPITTSYAVIALLGKTLPTRTITSSQSSEKYTFRIEGKNETVCSGATNAVTALDIVKNAKEQCGFSYTIAETSFGPYLKKINDDEANGLIGWLYLVNSNSPDKGAADYQLKSGDSVVWYYGDFNWKPTKLTLSESVITTGTNTTVTVESYNGGTWSPLPSADIFFGVSSTKTDNNGKAQLSPTDGYYKVIAGKTGFIRSNAELLKVGSPTSGNVNLSVTIEPGQPGGNNDTIAFTVNPNTIDFGSLKPGSSSTKPLSIKNTGTKEIIIETAMTGDSLFTDNTQIDSATWKNFKTSLSRDASKSTNTTLTIPSNQSSTGTKSAVMTFWATAK